jgi:hypothetical protein
MADDEEQNWKPHLDHLRNDLNKTALRCFREAEWGKRHVAAFLESGVLSSAACETPDQEQAVALLLLGWLAYADAHKDSYGTAIGEDSFLSEHWEAIGDGLHGFLSGELGRFDADALDSAIVAAMKREGMDR